MVGAIIANLKKYAILFISLFCLVLFSGCIGASGPSDHSTITLYAYSVPEEALIQQVIPAFQDYWKSKTGDDIKIETSFAGSGTITNQIIAGAPAEVAFLSHELDAIRLRNAGQVSQDWTSYSHSGIVFNSPFIIMVRQGNPKQIKSFEDMAKPGIDIIIADPSTSGGAMWSIYGIYGGKLKETETDLGRANPEAAKKLLQEINLNIVSMPSSARAAMTTFEAGIGDALVTYENEYLLMKSRGRSYEAVYPRSTIISEQPIVIVDTNVAPEERELIEAFVNFQWRLGTQASYAKYGFRSVISAVNAEHPEFSEIELPFTISYLGGWESAKSEIIDKIWADIQTNNR